MLCLVSTIGIIVPFPQSIFSAVALDSSVIRSGCWFGNGRDVCVLGGLGVVSDVGWFGGGV